MRINLKFTPAITIMSDWSREQSGFQRLLRVGFRRKLPVVRRTLPLDIDYRPGQSRASSQSLRICAISASRLSNFSSGRMKWISSVSITWP